LLGIYTAQNAKEPLPQEEMALLTMAKLKTGAIPA
jgi:hypothetical protein